MKLRHVCSFFHSRALVLGKQEVGGVAVTLVADSFGRGTTSDGSGGLWEPYKLGDTPAQLINKWGAETYDYLQVGGPRCLHASTPATRPSCICWRFGCSCLSTNVTQVAAQQLGLWHDMEDGNRVSGMTRLYRSGVSMFLGVSCMPCRA